jgi:hypothetical protein
MDLTNSFSTAQSLETNVSSNSRSLSEELLANSTVFNKNSNSLGGLYENTIEYGDPLTDADYGREQDGTYSCAVVAQISIYESLTGEFITEADAVEYADAQGWFDPASGTFLEDTGNLLEVQGIDTYSSYNNSFADLEDALAIGDKPIVALDGNEIWYPKNDRRGNSLEQEDAGHAVWVTGINYESDGSIDVILNDSGIADEEGIASVVDYYDFMNAWSDYDSFATIAENPFV